jgi:hypothetical protein
MLTLSRLLNFLWFFNEIRKSECDARIRKSSASSPFSFRTSHAVVVIISGIGATIWAILIAVWAASFNVSPSNCLALTSALL